MSDNRGQSGNPQTDEAIAVLASVMYGNAKMSARQATATALLSNRAAPLATQATQESER